VIDLTQKKPWDKDLSKSDLKEREQALVDSEQENRDSRNYKELDLVKKLSELEVLSLNLQIRALDFGLVRLWARNLVYLLGLLTYRMV
jgi:hypothetical protein